MEVLESVLGYNFRDRQLLIMALTHGSVGYEAQRDHLDNQRLEFLGDAVLQLMLSELLYKRLPKADEGELTKLRAQIVSTKALAAVARRLNLGSFLIMGKGEAANGGRTRESTLADAMEAVTGAIYLDGGPLAVQNLTHLLFAKDLEKLLVDQPLFTPDLSHLALWMAAYYAAPLSKVMSLVLPSFLRKVILIFIDSF